MRFPTVSLRWLLPVLIVVPFSVVGLASYFVAVADKREVLLDAAERELRGAVASLARASERLIRSDPSLLRQELTLLALEPNLAGGAIVDDQGLVLHATRFASVGEPAVRALDFFQPSIDTALQRSTAVIARPKDRQEIIVALMRFAMPADSGELRSSNYGVAYLCFDLSDAIATARKSALRVHLPEAVLNVLVAALLAWAMVARIAIPLQRLNAATKRLAEGGFSSPLPGEVTKEIDTLAASFNHMSSRLKQSMEQSDSSARHMQAVIDNVLEAIVTIDERGRIQSFNQAAEKIFGFRADEVVGVNVSILMPGEISRHHDEYLARYQRTKEAHVIGFGRETTGRRRDGEEFPVELSVSEISKDGRPLYVGLLRDLSERNRVDRMKREFISTVSHELRTPLTSVVASLRLLASGALGTLPPKGQRLIEIAAINSGQLSNLINDLLDLEKIAAGKMSFDLQPQPVGQLLAEAVAASTPNAGQRGIEFKLLDDSSGAEVRIDASRLTQVLSNFLSNAIKFSPANERVDVAARLHEGDLRIEVRDRGPGVPAEFRDRIFQKFSQADSSDTRKLGGTGLGLAISKELVERMGGKIGFESEKGAGALFFCTFPLA